jgi:3',5'-cyclic AMP phosphodiesterase CpdA
MRVVVISDLNGSYGSTDYAGTVHSAIAAIIQLKPDVVISTGDMVAGQRRPALSADEVGRMWQGFHAAVTSPLEAAGIPFLVTPGNHDASAYRGFARERMIYREQWKDRAPSGVSGDWPFAYAVDFGGIRFVSLDATTVGALPADQMRWLESLQDDGGLTVAFSHLPLHPIAQDRETEIIGDPELARIFDTIGADLHLTGHHHAFYVGSADGIAFVAQSCLGGGARSLIGSQARSGKGFTVIDVVDGQLQVVGLGGSDFAPITLSSLPQRIGQLTRLDLLPTQTVVPQQ